jgi:RimJ/RimL family protein N-acetyltransferase
MTPTYFFTDKSGNIVVVTHLERSRCQEEIQQELKQRYAAFSRESFRELPAASAGKRLEWVQQDLLAPDTCNLVAITPEAALLGHAALFPYRHRPAGELLVAVWQEHQNRGIGTWLVRSAIRAARTLRFGMLDLFVDTTNGRARRVYENCGFQYGKRPPCPCGLVRMFLSLTPPIDNFSPRPAANLLTAATH